MTSFFQEEVAKNLRQPGTGLFGWYVTKLFIKHNSVLEENAATLCQIEPDHHVLEVGFGPGIGLETAYKFVEDGSGKIYGAEISDKMIEVASKRLECQINNDKLEILKGSAGELPFKENSFDRVFHCNCYHFWPDLEAGCGDLYRVMKADTIMVTTTCTQRVNNFVEKGCLKYGRYDTNEYMRALEITGFQNVHMDQIVDDSGLEFQAIFAHVGKSKYTRAGTGIN